MNKITNKVFVGNVPYQCTKDEFIDCFKNMQGFIYADVIKKQKTKLSRGFGFVLFKTKDDAIKLLEKNIMIRGRPLRLSPYNLDTDECDNRSVYIANLQTDMTNDDLRDIMSHYGPINSCSVNKRNNKMFGVVSFVNEQSYNKALEDPIINGDKYDIHIYQKRKVQKYKKKPDFQFQAVYQEGFKTGQIIGYQQGYTAGLKEKNHS